MKKPNILCVIPARLGSTRLPRKMLAILKGRPLIEHTYLGALKSDLLDKIVVATDSEEIADVIRRLKGGVVMTDPHIQTGSDRVAAVAKLHPEADVVVNLQGDEPFVQPQMIQTLLSPYLRGENPPMATVAFPIEKKEDLSDPGIVKVVTDLKGRAIYFSRSPIPFFRSPVEPMPVMHHMGLYAYQRDFLLTYTKLEQTPLEQAEALEQLRAMEHGYWIHVSRSHLRSLEVNTAEELERAQRFV